MLVIKTNNIKKIQELDNECFNDNCYSLNQYETMKNNHEFHLIQVDVIDVCFVIVFLVGNDIELIKIGIIKEYRRRSLAYDTISFLLNNLKYNQFFLEVSSQNNAAIKLYEKLNFIKITIRKNYYKDNSDAFIYVYTSNPK